MTLKNKKTLFPKKNIIYFDQGATSLKPSIYIDKYSQLSTGNYQHNPKTTLSFLKKLSNFLDTTPNHVSLVFNATHAANEIANQIQQLHQDKKTIYINKSEHLSNYLPWIKIAKLHKLKISFFDLEKFESINFDANSLVVLSSLTNLGGHATPINVIEKKAQNLKNICWIVDATQLIQHQKINLQNTHIDFLFFSAHKFFGPFGIGVVYSNNPSYKFGINCDNYANNSKYQLDWVGIKAWNESFDEISKNFLDTTVQNKEKELILHFQNNFPKNDLITWLNPDVKYPIFLLQTSEITAHDLMFLFEKNKIFTRAGLSCSYSEKYRKNSNYLIRISLNFSNNTKELDKLFLLLKNLTIKDCF